MGSLLLEVRKERGVIGGADGTNGPFGHIEFVALCSPERLHPNKVSSHTHCMLVISGQNTTDLTFPSKKLDII